MIELITNKKPLELITVNNETVKDVYDNGYQDGEAQGYNLGKADGYAEGLPVGIEQGRQAENEEFWDSYQNYYNPKYCKSRFFGKGWNRNNFYPKYDMQPTTAMSMFQEFGDTREAFSLKERLEECGVVLDMSECTSWNYAFYGTPFTELPHLDTRKTSQLNFIFQISSVLETISIQIRDDGSQIWNKTFSGCPSLKNLTITSGAIGGNGFNVSDSTKISKASLISILEACKKDVTASPITITLPSKCIDGATDTEALLESLGGDYETTVYTYGASTLQLPHTNIKPNTISLIPVDENGNQTNPDWVDDGNGNIINPYYPEDMQFVGTINYATGLIDISSGYGYFGVLNEYTKCQYTVDSAYNMALSKGYNIAFA